MKKLLVSLIFCFMMVLSVTAICYADSQVFEKPEIDIVIDGQVGTYTDVPIIVNDRTLLPLRQILVNLGVPNDDAHIIWNNAERSVTVKKDQTTLYLKIGSKEVSVDDATIIIDVEPMIYKDRTYIPARFVAQSLGKKVLWNGDLKAVLIRDESKFNEVKSILEKTNTAMTEVNKVKINTTTDMVTNGVNVKITGVSLIDNKKEIAQITQHMTSMGQEMDYTLYIANNATYQEIPNTSKYLKTPLTDSEMESNTLGLNYEDTLYACLSISEGSSSDEIVLKGNIDLEGFSVQGDGSTTMITSKTYYTEITIDKNSNTLLKVYMDISGQLSQQGMKIPVQIKTTLDYTDYNSDFEVTIPEDLEANAIEK